MTHFAARRPRFLLVCLCALLWLPGLFAIPATDRDEARFAEATKQMVQSGDFVRIMNGTEARSKKPVGIHWLQAPFVAAAGALGIATHDPIWPYRLPSLAGGIVAVLATFEIGLVLGFAPDAALLAAGLLAGTLLLGTEARIAKTDAALLGCTTLAMLGLLRAARDAGSGFWLLWGGLAAGILVKGPIAPMVLGLTAAAWSVTIRSVAWGRRTAPLRGVCVLLLLTLPWFVAIAIETHGRFFRDAVGGDLGGKLAGGSESHGGIPGEHLLLLPLLVFPGTWAILRALPGAVARRREPAIAFLLCWLVPAWAVFEAVPTKLPHYTLPLYPALCLLAAVPARAATTIRFRWAEHAALALQALVGAALAAASLALPFALGTPLLPGLLTAAAFLLAAALGTRGGPLIRIAAPIPAAFALFGWLLPGSAPLFLAPRAASLVRSALPSLAPDARGLAACGYAEPSLVFALGPKLLLLPNGRSCAEVLATGLATAALLDTRDRSEFDAAARDHGVHTASRGTVRGLNYSRGRWTMLELLTADPPHATK